MKVALITGSGGLVGSECVEFFADKFDLIVGIDNDMRAKFFGQEASTEWNMERLSEKYDNFVNHFVDIRDYKTIEQRFLLYHNNISLIVHTAAQPSHDWAAFEPLTDFNINAGGTLNLLELTRLYCPNAVFIFTSTNKVYGDNPNKLPLRESTYRYEIEDWHDYYTYGIDEKMSVDNTTHSLFGCSKLAADVLVQEYGKYFGIKTGVFRGGCLTGGNHSGAQQHGFLSYLMKCCIEQTPYTIFGYKGKQVRDNLHATDLVNMFWQYYQHPEKGEVYNVGGGWHSNCSVLEAIQVCEKITGNEMVYRIVNEPRKGDHIWYVSDVRKFKQDYPTWDYTYNLQQILEDIFNKTFYETKRL